MTDLALAAPHELPRVRAYLDARLAHAEAVIDRLTLDPDGASGLARITDAAAAVQQAARAATAAGVTLPDERVAKRFGLGPLDLDVLWLVTAPAIDPALALALRRIDAGSNREAIDPGLLARGLGADRGGRLAVLATLDAGAPLRRTRLVRVSSVDRPHGRELHPASWLPGYLRGVRVLGARLEAAAELVTPAIVDGDVPLPDTAADLVPLLAGCLAAPTGEPAPIFGVGGLEHPRGVAIWIHGAAGSGRTVLARALAGRLGRRMLLIDAGRLRMATFAAASELLDAACSEAAAMGELLVIRSAHDVAAVGANLAVPFARAVASYPVVALLLGVDEGPLAPEIEAVLVRRHLHQMKPQQIDGAHLWLTNLPPSAELDAELDIDAVARAIHLTPAQVRAAARVAVLTAQGRPLRSGDLDAAARTQIGGGIGKLAELQEATLRRTDLVLPDDQRAQVDEIIAAAQNRDLVLRRWGLRRAIKRGLSISALFDGPPGTGKTLAAEVIASELGLQLLRIDVSSIVDKFIGETEKNLTRVFESARPDTTLLLFDEADSLFSKRTEVQHAVDRYSNMDVNVLLQLLERFEGTAVLTPNLRRSIDTAFERRIMFKVRFERPDVEQRRQIWMLMLPSSIPTAETIDYDRLARLDLAGGEIKNAVLRAAYAAAREGGALRMRHLQDAAAHEAAATGRVYFDASGHG